MTAIEAARAALNLALQEYSPTQFKTNREIRLEAAAVALLASTEPQPPWTNWEPSSATQGAVDELEAQPLTKPEVETAARKVWAHVDFNSQEAKDAFNLILAAARRAQEGQQK